MRHILTTGLWLDPNENGPNAGDFDADTQAGETPAETNDAGDGGVVDRGPSTSAAPAPDQTPQAKIGPEHGEYDGEEEDESESPAAEAGDEIGGLTDAAVDELLADAGAKPDAATSQEKGVPATADAANAADAGSNAAAVEIPADLKPFLEDNFGSELVESFPEVKPIIEATKQLAKTVQEQNKRLATMAAPDQISKAVAAALGAQRIHSAMDSELDEAVYGNFTRGELTPEQNALRVKCDAMAAELYTKAKAKGTPISQIDALRMVQYRVPGVKKPQNQITREAARAEAMQHARKQAATRTPAGIKPGITSKPKAARKESDWAERIRESLA